MYTFEQCYSAYSGQIYSFISHKVKTNDVDDLSQEVWMKVFTSLKKRDQINNISGWIYGVARHVVIDFWREKKNNQDNNFSLEGVVSSNNNITYSDERALLNNSLESLDEKTKSIIKSRYYQGAEIHDISVCLGITPGNTRIRLHRGVRRLRDLVAGGTQKYKYQLL